MGLPKIVKKEIKSCNISARVSETEYFQLQEIKAKYGLVPYDVLKIGIEYILYKMEKEEL